MSRRGAVVVALAAVCCGALRAGAEVTILGTAIYNGPANGTDIARSVAVVGSGNVVVAGDEQGVIGASNWRIRRYDPTLTTLLSTTAYNSPGNSDDLAT